MEPVPEPVKEEKGEEADWFSWGSPSKKDNKKKGKTVDPEPVKESEPEPEPELKKKEENTWDAFGSSKKDKKKKSKTVEPEVAKDPEPEPLPETTADPLEDKADDND